MKERVRRGEILLTFTDKDSRVVVCQPESCSEAAKVHLEKDVPVTWDKVPETITLMNRTARSVVKMFRIGEEGSESQRDRITKAVITPDTSPPAVSFLWKTHKEYIHLPPTRPVCDSSNGSIARVSELWTKIMMDMRKYMEKWDATEDMLAAVQAANEDLKTQEVGQDISLISMDARPCIPASTLKISFKESGILSYMKKLD